MKYITLGLDLTTYTPKRGYKNITIISGVLTLFTISTVVCIRKDDGFLFSLKGWIPL